LNEGIRGHTDQVRHETSVERADSLILEHPPYAVEFVIIELLIPLSSLDLNSSFDCVKRVKQALSKDKAHSGSSESNVKLVEKAFRA
jgi:hypothetical protein